MSGLERNGHPSRQSGCLLPRRLPLLSPVGLAGQSQHSGLKAQSRSAASYRLALGFVSRLELLDLRPSVAWEAGDSARPPRIWLLLILCRGLRRSGPHPRARERVDGTVHRESTSQREGPFLSQAEASPGRLQLWFLTSCCSSDSTTHPTGRAQDRKSTRLNSSH